MATAVRPGLPTRAVLRADGLHVAMADIAVDELRDPFLQETVQRLGGALALAHVPPADLGQDAPATAPAGLIFHVARCGSTLASQLLKCQPGLVVYSEPLALSEVLLPPHAVPRAMLVAALRTLGGMLARHAGQPYVLKLTSWNTLFCDLVAEAFPTTPWAMCLRDPLEVCVSLLQGRPGWLRDNLGATFSALVDPGATAHGDEALMARVYAAFCEAGARLDASRGLLLHFEDLPGVVWQRLAPHFGLQPENAAQQAMAAEAAMYSKARVGQARAYVPDSQRKRESASVELRLAVDRTARPARERLVDSLRT
ncbi:MAG: hypothetical protein ACKVQR_03705 [Aquabacterium sp.]